MVNKHIKRCSASHVIRELQVKAMRYHYTSIRMAKIQNIDIIKCWQGSGATGSPVLCSLECKMVQLLWNIAW